MRCQADIKHILLYQQEFDEPGSKHGVTAFAETDLRQAIVAFKVPNLADSEERAAAARTAMASARAAETLNPVCKIARASITSPSARKLQPNKDSFSEDDDEDQLMLESEGEVEEIEIDSDPPERSLVAGDFLVTRVSREKGLPKNFAAKFLRLLETIFPYHIW